MHFMQLVEMQWKMMQASSADIHVDKSDAPRRHLVVVQCRSSSTRLPGKAMMTLNGIPMLSFLLRRLKDGLPKSRYKIMLATTENIEDDIIANLGKKEEVEVLRGDENDVLKRYLKCIDVFPADIIVRVTADNPFTCPEVLECAVNEMIKKKVDYLKCENLPLGSGVDVFSSNLLKQLDVVAKEPQEREHINMYVLKNKEKYATSFVHFEGKRAHPSMRITVDTLEDLENVRSLFKQDDVDSWRMPLLEIIKRMDPSTI
jgi:spore coat polysaccharide biosynthesis protein SpsF